MGIFFGGSHILSLPQAQHLLGSLSAGPVTWALPAGCAGLRFGRGKRQAEVQLWGLELAPSFSREAKMELQSGLEWTQYPVGGGGMALLK